MKENLQHTIKAFIRKGGKYYIAECLEIPVVTQGKTLDEVVGNLKEAVALHLEGEDLEQLGFAPNPTLIITMETEPVANFFGIWKNMSSEENAVIEEIQARRKRTYRTRVL
jgi:predicted RNase H-like HicB family nuclease